MDGRYEVVVIGGGAAGLSGALTLARARRSVLVIDAGEPRNAPAAGVHGLLALDGTPPAELVRRGAEEVRGYGGELVHGVVDGVERTDDGFVVRTADGRRYGAERLLVTTGLVDELPDVEGLAARWGRDVIHCPYCHGHEVGDGRVGVLATSPISGHQALLFGQWTPNVTLLVNGTAFSDDDLERFEARGVRIVEGEVTGLVVEGDRLRGARLADGTVEPVDAIAVATRLAARAGFLGDLGLATEPFRMGDLEIGERITVDATGRTAAPGVWAAGNVTDLAAQVGPAAAAATSAAAQINLDLVMAETDRAVASLRDARAAAGAS